MIRSKDKISKENGKLSSTQIWSILCIILITCIMCYTLYQNNVAKRLLESRNTSLDFHESTKQWVLDDLRLLLTIKDEDSYIKAKENMHLTKDLKISLFSTNYESMKDNFLNADNVGFIDAQYTLINDRLVYYVLANIYQGEDVKPLNLLVYVDDNLISNIIAY